MGEWKNDMRDGHGVLSIPEDSKVNSKNYNTSKMLKVYVGNWRNDKKDGLGTFSYPDSSLYEGQWSSDYRQGWGKMSYPDGSIYEGEWYGGKRHGNGTLLLRNFRLICSKRGQIRWIVVRQCKRRSRQIYVLFEKAMLYWGMVQRPSKMRDYS